MSQRYQGKRDASKCDCWSTPVASKAEEVSTTGWENGNLLFLSFLFKVSLFRRCFEGIGDGGYSNSLGPCPPAPPPIYF